MPKPTRKGRWVDEIDPFGRKYKRYWSMHWRVVEQLGFSFLRGFISREEYLKNLRELGMPLELKRPAEASKECEGCYFYEGGRCIADQCYR